MKVSTTQPFIPVYAIYSHEYLGYLFESFIVQLDSSERMTLRHQNISHKNAEEFAKGLDETDYEIIKLIDQLNQELIIKKFYNKKIKPVDFFPKIYDKEKGDKTIQGLIDNYVERVKSQIFELLPGKKVYEMGKDGEPTYKELFIQEEKATILFHFRRNDDNTHYFPTIKFKDEKLDFQYKNAVIISKEPAWMLLENNLYTFAKNVDGSKLKPFLNKKFIQIPKNIEEKYYKNFVAQLVANFDVYAKGFDIITESPAPEISITLYDLIYTQNSLSLFGDENKATETPEDEKVVLDISVKYGDYTFYPENKTLINVRLEKEGDNYTFHRIKRKLEWEKENITWLNESGLDIKNNKALLPKISAFDWLYKNKPLLEEKGIKVQQNFKEDKTYFLGDFKIDLVINEKADWFDINAVVRFGEYEIPFIQLRSVILSKKKEFTLPNGQVAVIPEEWITNYGDLISFTDPDGDDVKLKKHHISLIHDIQKGNRASITMDRKIERLKDFETIEDFEMPKGFKGKLRPYQKAGFNWLLFLNQYSFGGCLADDMGLGKTIQTLALLLSRKEENPDNTSMLIVPTSLIYNWELEAKKFVPDLKILRYTGTNRTKNIEKFAEYDVVVTSYGTIRMDSELVQEFYFDYLILDESQAIKNPNSQIAKEIKKLKSRNKLQLKIIQWICGHKCILQIQVC